MSQYSSELSNTSYTNKDFADIYPELLALAKSISYKWDPTVSDESDPGVVLLKLAALMADKLNYNIDKNVLETSPVSVTQLGNARALFDQCGYTMRYYQSATTDITMSISQEPDYNTIKDHNNVPLNVDPGTSLSYLIPRFTMISDAENNLVYTLTRSLSLSNTVHNQTVPAIQGTCVNYDVNGDTVITAAHLDYRNRLYFTETNIAENGIFVRHANIDNVVDSGNDWRQVENLEIQDLNTKCYKFGVSRDGNQCFIEFPSGIHNLIGEGLKITYILSDGQNGNAGRKQLCQLYSDELSNIIVTSYDENISGVYYTSLNNNNLYISNTESARNGCDPEDIFSAYQNYERTKGTFDTLVSLTDYTNFLKNSPYASNGIVCDRTNDIQRAHKIITQDNSGRQSKLFTIDQKDVSTTVTGSDKTETTVTIKQDSMQPYDLCIYALSHVDNINSAYTFDASFDLMPNARHYTSTAISRLCDSFEDVKSIQHNFINYEMDKPLIIYNKYSIRASIIPNSKLESIQMIEVKENVKQALYSTLNASKLSFGEEIKYDVLYDAILHADSRIKAVLLDAITYDTYVCYFSSQTKALRRLDLSTVTDASSAEERAIKDSILLNCALAGVTPVYTVYEDFNYSLDQDAVSFGAVLTDSGADSERDKTATQPYPGEAGTVPAVKDTVSPYCDNVSRITTSLRIPSSDLNGSDIFNISANESVVFVAPNFVLDREFSSYCKFVTNIQEISAAAEHIISEEEYIVFFWKSDNNDAAYTYAKYTEGSIICPSFNIIRNDQDYATKIDTNCIADKGTIRDETFNSDIKAMNSDNFVLSGTRSVSAKRTNTITVNHHLNGTSAVFWMLNSSVLVNGHARSYLFDESCISDGKLEYILKQGEYFLYTDTRMSTVYMLGTGTSISFEPNSGSNIDLQSVINQWYCPTISYDELLKKGFIEYLDDRWFYCTRSDKTYQLKATEMRYIQVGEGTRITLKRNTGVESVHPVISRDYLHLDSTTYSEVTYTVDRGEPVRLPEIKGSSAGWKCYGILNIQSSPDSPQVLNLSHNHEMILHYKRSATAQQDSTKLIKSYNTNFNGSGENVEIRVATNRPVTLLGGPNVDVTCLNESGSLDYLSVYTFKHDTVAVDETNAPATNNPFDKTVRLLHKKSYESFINFKLPSGYKYIIPVSLHSPCIGVFITDANGYCYPLGMEQTYSLTELKMYYLEADFSGNVDTITYNLKGTANSGSTAPIVVVFHAPVKVSEHSNTSHILKLIGKDTAAANVFDYSHVIDSNNMISDPCDPSSFLRHNHPYNPFTICQWDLSNIKTDIVISNNVRG